MHTLPKSPSSATEPNFAEGPFRALSVCHGDIAVKLGGMNDLAVQLYRQHMALEDSFAYPLARQQLNADAVCTMNREMAHRRVRDEAAEDQDDGWV